MGDWDEERAAERKAAAVLAGWLESDGIAKGDTATETASVLAESSLMRCHVAVLLTTGEALRVLRDAAEGIAEVCSVDPAEWALENYRHGHGERPGLIRIGEVIND